jgi:SRSO17 transposase
MFPIVEIPHSIESLISMLRLEFSIPKKYNLKKYITGLIVSDRPTIFSINSMFLDGKDQSSLNRFLTESNWDEEEVNEKRIELLQKYDQSKWNENGVVSIDDSIVHKTGEKIEGVDYVYDHCENKSVLGFDVVTSHYVDEKKDYPLDVRLYLRKETLEEDENLSEKFPFKTRIELACELVDDAEKMGIPSMVYVFDSWYFCQELAEKIESYQKFWISKLKSDRLVLYEGKQMQISEFAKQLPNESFRKVKLNDKEYYTFSKSMKLANTENKVRIVISYEKGDRSDTPSYFVTNNLLWEAKRILTLYSLRWPIDSFYRDAKQNLGFEKSQLRNLKGIIRHWYLVFLAYSLLKIDFLTSKLNRSISTIGQACRKVAEHIVESLIVLVYRLFKENKSIDQVVGMIIKG